MQVLQLIQSSPALYLTVTLLLGLIVGSFLNVVIYRLPLMMERGWRRHCAELIDELAGSTGEASFSVDGRRIEARLETAAAEAAETPQPFNLVTPRSRCTSCEHQISAWHNIPVASYLMLKGRCAHCGTRIPARYPAIELLTGVASAIVVWRFGLTVEAGLALVLTWALIALSGIDIDRQLLPDSITLPLLWLALLASLFAESTAAEALFVTPAAAIVGAVAGYLSLWSIYQLFRLMTGKEGMGYGDFKLLAVLGAWFGWQMLPLIILLSAVVGAIVGVALIVFAGRARHQPIPFGPYLAAAGWVAVLWGQDIMDRYLGVGA